MIVCRCDKCGALCVAEMQELTTPPGVEMRPVDPSWTSYGNHHTCGICTRADQEKAAPKSFNVRWWPE